MLCNRIDVIIERLVLLALREIMEFRLRHILFLFFRFHVILDIPLRFVYFAVTLMDDKIKKMPNLRRASC